jgi:hypothetical protein
MKSWICKNCKTALTSANCCPSSFNQHRNICRKCEADRTRRRRARERGISFEDYSAFQELRKLNRENPHCRGCGAKLGDDNWTAARRIHRDYFCQSCSSSYGSGYYRGHRKEIINRGKRYYAAHKRENKDAKLRRLFGISLEQYQTLVVRQGAKCAACHKPLGKIADGALRPVVDHDHESRRVRGIIHANCNCIIGFARENPTILDYLASYLRINRRF